MTADEIIDLAHKAGNPAITRYGLAVVTIKWMENFATLVAASEREACAEVVDGFDTCDPKHIAAAIRARGTA